MLSHLLQSIAVDVIEHPEAEAADVHPDGERNERQLAVSRSQDDNVVIDAKQ